MFVRFVTTDKQEHSHHKLGMFQIFYKLERDGSLPSDEYKKAREIVDWFVKELPIPKKFSASKSHKGKEVALSWFRDNAQQHISKMSQLSEILREHGISIIIKTTERPGKIVYEDEFQVVAIPFNDTGA